MIRVRKATLDDVEGICRVCTEGWRDTYQHLYTQDYIERVIGEYYNPERIRNEIIHPEGWNGWLVADDNGVVVGAGGGGMTSPTTGEVFVLYLDPKRRGQGIGTGLLAAITEQQKQQGAREQWVSVERDNQKGMPFYLARGFVQKGEKRAEGTNPEEKYQSLRLWRTI